MTLARTCSECGTALLGKSLQAKTCGPACRSTRSRRQKRTNSELELLNEDSGINEITRIVRRESPDVAKDVIRKELGPIVRQALTEDVLRAIEKLVGLTGKAVAALEEDLGSEDATIRQRAYTLLIKYTAGHPALVKADDTTDSSQLVVNFNLPRPDVDQVSVLDTDATELKTCDQCNEEKPVDEFESGSDRCVPCFEKWKATIVAQYASTTA